MGLLIALPIFAVFAVVASLLLLLGARVAQIQERSFGRALTVTLIDFVSSLIVGGGLGMLGLDGGFIALVAAIALNLFIIKSIFNTSWGSAAIAWIVQMVALVVVVGVPMFMVFGAAMLASL